MKSERIISKIVGGITVGLFSFAFSAMFASSVFVASDAHAAVDIAAVVSTGGNYSISVSSSSLDSTIELDATATATGTMAIAKDTLNVKSNAPNGYQIYVAMARDNDCESNCNALKNSATSAYIPAVSATFDTPRVLTSNTWGYAIAKNGIGAPENSFSTAYSTEAPDSGTLWAAMPIKGEDQAIQTITTP